MPDTLAPHLRSSRGSRRHDARILVAKVTAQSALNGRLASQRSRQRGHNNGTNLNCYSSHGRYCVCVCVSVCDWKLFAAGLPRQKRIDKGAFNILHEWSDANDSMSGLLREWYGYDDHSLLSMACLSDFTACEMFECRRRGSGNAAD